MTYRGRVIDGVVVWDGEKPDDGTFVEVTAVSEPTSDESILTGDSGVDRREIPHDLQAIPVVSIADQIGMIVEPLGVLKDLAYEFAAGSACEPVPVASAPISQPALAISNESGDLPHNSIVVAEFAAAEISPDHDDVPQVGEVIVSSESAPAVGALDAEPAARLWNQVGDVAPVAEVKTASEPAPIAIAASDPAVGLGKDPGDLPHAVKTQEVGDSSPILTALIGQPSVGRWKEDGHVQQKSKAAPAGKRTPVASNVTGTPVVGVSRSRLDHGQAPVRAAKIPRHNPARAVAPAANPVNGGNRDKSDTGRPKFGNTSDWLKSHGGKLLKSLRTRNPSKPKPLMTEAQKIDPPKPAPKKRAVFSVLSATSMGLLLISLGLILFGPDSSQTFSAQRRDDGFHIVTFDAHQNRFWWTIYSPLQPVPVTPVIQAQIEEWIAQMSNDDITWARGVEPTAAHGPLEDLKTYVKSCTPQLLDALSDKQKFAVAHILLINSFTQGPFSDTSGLGRRHSLPRNYHGLRYRPRPDGSADYDSRQMSELQQYWAQALLEPTGQISFTFEPYPFAVLPVIWCIVRLTKLRKRLLAEKLGLCIFCGYDLRATPERCPECGNVPPPKITIDRIKIELGLKTAPAVPAPKT